MAKKIFNWRGDEVTDGIDFTGDPGVTKQSEAAACDMNNILRLHNKGLPILVSDLKPQFGDFSQVPDFASAMNLIADANSKFESLPANVREKFENDPVKFVEYVMDPKNEKDIIDLGLANAKLQVPVPVVSDSTPPAAPPAAAPAPAAPAPAATVG